jgi:hypothetical protein
LYLMQGSGLQAAQEFKRLRAQRGSDPFSPFYAAALVGAARAQAMAGNVAGSLQAYEQFFVAWTSADAEIPLLLRAREEYGRLSPTMTSAAPKNRIWEQP